MNKYELPYKLIKEDSFLYVASWMGLDRW
jgi:hypothetical protein